jgi:hypothetical protein
LGNVICALIVAFCALVYVRTSILQPIPMLVRLTDFSAYYHAGGFVLHGISPYNDPVFSILRCWRF